MRLCQSAGIADWQTAWETLPDSVLLGWMEFYSREPFGQNHLYDFLANAFRLVCLSLHCPTFAGEIQNDDFLWWKRQHKTPGRQPGETMTSAGFEAYFEAMTRQFPHAIRTTPERP